MATTTSRHELRDAETIRHLLLGRRSTGPELNAHAARFGIRGVAFDAALVRALRQELVEYDHRTETWGASRCRMFGGAS